MPRKDKIAQNCLLPHEQHPDAFAAYCRHFVDPCASWAFNCRVGYEGSFRRAKSWRKDGTRFNTPFIKSIRTNSLAKHLDRDAWNRRQAALGRQVLDEPFWLALLPGPMTPHLIVDLDNHEDVGGYLDENGHIVPVAWVGLDYVQRLKRIYGLKPDVLVSSSHNLGMHAYWRLPEPVPTTLAYQWMRGQLAVFGLDDMEVYPVPPGRRGAPDPQCHRRPFGEGSWTATASGWLIDWVEQTWHFDQPGPLPSFERLVELLLHRAEDQLAEGIRATGAEDLEDQRLAQNDEADRIWRWVEAGYPQTQADAQTTNTGSPRRPCRQSAATSPGRMPAEWRAKSFVQRCYELARDGLPEEDSANWVLYELGFR